MKEYIPGFLMGVGLAMIIFGQYLSYLESKPTFVSFNDGSIECITIHIPENSTKEKLAQALIQGHDMILGKIGNAQGCVNYEFAKQ